MSIRTLIAGNWKMNGTPEFGVTLAKELNQNFTCDKVDMLICPSFTSLIPVADTLKDGCVKLGAQNVHAEASGAHTGEISAEMLKACGCEYVITGHSERRAAGETDDQVAAKTCAALEGGLTPILCIGENAKMQPAEAQDVLEKQLRASMKNIAVTEGSQVVIAYEPVWAIGTGLVPTIDDLKEAFTFLRQLVIKTYGEEVGSKIRLLYGGSLNAENAADILAVTDINGGLIGGASLKAPSFLAIAEVASQYAERKA